MYKYLVYITIPLTLLNYYLLIHLTLTTSINTYLVFSTRSVFDILKYCLFVILNIGVIMSDIYFFYHGLYIYHVLVKFFVTAIFIISYLGFSERVNTNGE